MNSNYLNFNSWAFNYYIDRNTFNNECTLAIETSEVDNYCILHNCDLIFKEIISNDWSLLLKNISENHIRFPRYFGLLALQCYAGAKMHQEGNVRASNYKLRFSEIAGFASSHDLELAFSRSYNGVPIQEFIWIHAKEYLQKKHNLRLVVPSQSTHAGRYVKYPKSQIVLNNEDLKEYGYFFADVEKKYDNISELEFLRHYQNNIFKFSQSFIRKNNVNTNLSHLEKKIRLKQIFDSYCSGNWLKLDTKDSSRKCHVEKETFTLTLINQEIKIYDFFCREIQFSDSFLSKINKGSILIFKRSQDYPNEYDLTETLELDVENVFILNDFDVELYDFLSKSLTYVAADCKGLLIYKGAFSENSVPTELAHKVAKSFPVRLKGFKLSRKMEYLRAYAPEIIKVSDISLSVYCNGNRLYQYDRRNAEIGKYIIRIPGYSSLSFEIVDSPKLNGIVYNPGQGWKTSTFSIEDEDYDMQGFLLKDCADCMPLTINNWIEAQGGNRPTDQNKTTNNLLLKVLNGCRFKKYTR